MAAAEAENFIPQIWGISCGMRRRRPPLPSLEHVVLLRRPLHLYLSEESTLFDGLNGDGRRRRNHSLFRGTETSQGRKLDGKYDREAR